MFGTRDLGHNGIKFKKNYHLHKPSYICPIFHAENNVKASIQFCPFYWADFDPSWAYLFNMESLELYGLVFLMNGKSADITKLKISRIQKTSQIHRKTIVPD
jgi:hypothetical protein